MTIDPNHVPTTTEGDPDPLALVGTLIDGRYRLLEFIGQGGMGNVYRAEHKTIRKPVALKLMHPSLANIPEIRSRFEREAFAIGRIEHPNCVQVSDFGDLPDGSLFLVMEFLDGESVADLLDRQRPLPPEQALHITRYLLYGLAHAHAAGIVHRDVKPENIYLVEIEGDPLFAKLLDFGIAKLLDPPDRSGVREKLTQAGITFGTPTYISPEQALGDPADSRSDLYSATVVLYEMLAGFPPFRSEDKVELLAMHANRPPPALSETHPTGSFAPELEALIQRGLAKYRDHRFTEASELIAEIDALIGPLPRAPSQSDVASRPITGRAPILPHPATPLPLPTRAPTVRGESPAPRPWVGKVIAIAALVVALSIVAYVFSVRVQVIESVTLDKPSDTARRAGKELSEGDPERVVAMVQADPNSATDPAAQLKLGHAQAALAQYSEALVAYDNALKLEPNLARDPDLLRNLGLMVDDSGPMYVDALRLQIVHGDNEDAKKLLVEVASGRRPRARAEARELAESLGLSGQVDKVQGLIWDLLQGKNCGARAKAIGPLRTLDDKRAIKPLESLISTRRLRRRNRCLRAAARDAIKYLESLPGPDPRSDTE
jgi:serine/threonine-protein kinase